MHHSSTLERSGDRYPRVTGSIARPVVVSVHDGSTEDRARPDVAHVAGVARFVGGTVALFLVALTLWGLVVAVVPAAALRWESVVVTSGSMTPALRPGDVVLAQPADDELSAGSVAVFHNNDGRGLVTHRITGANPDGSYVTKGDANPQVDSTPLPTENVTGTARLRIPLIGTPLLWVQNGDWVPLIALTLALGVLAWLSRFALRPEFDPWAHRSGSTPAPAPADSGVRPWNGSTVVLGRRADHPTTLEVVDP